ncbi:MAG: transketolase family protein [Vulcanimicrobiota bacterium]
MISETGTGSGTGAGKGGQQLTTSLLLEEPSTAFGPYGRSLVSLGEREERLVVLGADLANSTEIDGFAKRFPNRFFNIGAAEQNAVNIAAGLAFEGEIPFVHSFGVFVTRRTYDQVCVQIALHRANVKLIGVIPGLTSRLGPTHQAIDDLALMRLLPDMTVIDPADATEIEQAVHAIAEYDGPVYMRAMRREVPVMLNPASYRFSIGKAVILRSGSDVAVLSTGLILKEALSAVKLLEQRGIKASLLHVPTLKPLDREAVLNAAASAGAVVTVENHLTGGGLGGAIAELLADEMPLPMGRVGLQDTFAEPGTPEYLFTKYGLTDSSIVETALQTMKRKRG